MLISLHSLTLRLLHFDMLSFACESIIYCLLVLLTSLMHTAFTLAYTLNYFLNGCMQCVTHLASPQILFISHILMRAVIFKSPHWIYTLLTIFSISLTFIFISLLTTYLLPQSHSHAKHAFIFIDYNRWFWALVRMTYIFRLPQCSILHYLIGTIFYTCHWYILLFIEQYIV